MLDQDALHRIMGEIAIGTNYAITEFSRNTLFDEKIGGIVPHGRRAGYPESGNRTSPGCTGTWSATCGAQYAGGSITADGEVFHKDGQFQPVVKGWAVVRVHDIRHHIRFDIARAMSRSLALAIEWRLSTAFPLASPTSSFCLAVLGKRSSAARASRPSAAPASKFHDLARASSLRASGVLSAEPVGSARPVVLADADAVQPGARAVLSVTTAPAARRFAARSSCARDAAAGRGRLGRPDAHVPRQGLSIPPAHS